MPHRHHPNEPYMLPRGQERLLLAFTGLNGTDYSLSLAKDEEDDNMVCQYMTDQSMRLDPRSQISPSSIIEAAFEQGAFEEVAVVGGSTLLSVQGDAKELIAGAFCKEHECDVIGWGEERDGPAVIFVKLFKMDKMQGFPLRQQGAPDLLEQIAALDDQVYQLSGYRYNGQGSRNGEGSGGRRRRHGGIGIGEGRAGGDMGGDAQDGPSGGRRFGGERAGGRFEGRREGRGRPRDAGQADDEVPHYRDPSPSAATVNTGFFGNQSDAGGAFRGMRQHTTLSDNATGLLNLHPAEIIPRNNMSAVTGREDIYMGHQQRPHIIFTSPNGIKYTLTIFIGKGKDGIKDSQPLDYILDEVRAEYERRGRTPIFPEDPFEAAYANGDMQPVAIWNENAIIAASGPMQCPLAYSAEADLQMRVIGAGRTEEGENVIFLECDPIPHWSAKFNRWRDEYLPFDVKKDMDNLRELGFDHPDKERPDVTAEFRYLGGEHGPSRDDPKTGYKRLREQSEAGGSSAGATGARRDDDRHRRGRHGDHSSSRHVGSRHPQGRRA
ncbi:MAG: hypothetical protein M1836_005426 [Candelina mexicana]|nr:MAG: hypothetical protein M1836_005426 [Candelina mexicana]